MKIPPKFLIIFLIAFFPLYAASTDLQIVSVTSEPVDCSGEATGSITIQISGGTAPYYYWFGGPNGTAEIFDVYTTSHTFYNVQAGSYFILVKDALDNEVFSNTYVTEPAPLITFVSPNPFETCPETDSQLDGNPAGGNGNYAHEWTGSGAGLLNRTDIESPVFKAGTSGIYDLTYKVTDNKGCEAEETIDVRVFQTISAEFTSEDVTCFGGNNGSITVTDTIGGSGNFQYSIDGSAWQTSNIFESLEAGIYNVWVRDAAHHECSVFIGTAQVEQPATAVGGSIVSQTNVLCYGEATGSVTVEGSGGTGPYRYSLDGGELQTSGTFEFLAAGTYTVTVVDASDCDFDVNVTITQPSAVDGSIVSQTNVLCYGEATGSVTVEGSGGTGPYRYSLDGGELQTSGTFEFLAAGTYTVTVVDASDCDYDVNVTITQPSAVDGSIVSQTNVLCYGEATGSVMVEGSGGTPPYRYRLDGGIYKTSRTFGSLAAGNYTITVADANNCEYDIAVTITQPATAVEGNIVSQTNVLCFGETTGSVTVEGSEGTGPYHYSLDGGDLQVSGTFDFLAAGDYTVTVFDANGCYVDVAVTITQPDMFSTDIIITDIDCFGAENGVINVSAEGGALPYTYRLFESGVEIDSQTSENPVMFGQLAPGSYQVEVIEANGCIGFSDEITLDEPDELVIEANYATDIICPGDTNGTIIVEAAGGTGDLEYSVNNGTDFFANDGIFNELTEGTYHVVVRDERGCETAWPEEVIISDPPAIQLLDTEIIDASCFGALDGSIKVSATGGTGSLHFSLDNDSYQTAGLFANLSAGSYTLYVKDENSCIRVYDLGRVEQPDILEVSALVLNVDCFDDTGDPEIMVTATGGTAPYAITLYLDGVEQDSRHDISESEPVYFGSLTKNITDYLVVVDDTRDCGPVSSGTLSTVVPDELMIELIDYQSPLCFGPDEGQIEVSALGGTAPYTYLLYNDQDDVVETIESESSVVFESLPAGTYRVGIGDVSGCGPVTSEVIIIEQPEEVVIDFLAYDDVSCHGLGDGAVTIMASGGTGSLVYSINGGVDFYSSGSFTGLNAGSYEVIVRDYEGCVFDAGTVEIAEPEELLFDFIHVQDIVIGSQNEYGSIETGITGGTGSYLYSIDNGTTWQSENLFGGLEEGEYHILVSDEKDCMTDTTLHVSRITGASAQIESQDPTCHGYSDGEISVLVDMGTSPYRFSINGENVTETNDSSWIFIDMPAGIYQVTVTDADNHIYEQTVALDGPDPVDAIATVSNAACSRFDPDGIAGPDGAISLSVTGGTGDYSYQWSNGAETKDVLQLAAGDYTVTITDGNGCQSGHDVVVGYENAVDVSIIEDEYTICHGSEVQLQTEVMPAGVPVTYSWTASDGSAVQPVASPTVIPSGSTLYRVEVIDENFCYDDAEVVVDNYPLQGISIGNDTVLFQGATIELEAKGGDFVSYEWTPSAGLSDVSGAVTSATVMDDIEYFVYAVTSDGCEEHASISISVLLPVQPVSGFTPNGDGINDLFDIPNAADYSGIVVEVFNRAGQRVFYSEGYSDDRRWDGTYNGRDLPLGTYYYVITLNDGFGTRPVTGSVTILR